MTDLHGLRKFYAQTASGYESQVVPVFGPLAQSLSGWIARCVAEHRQYTLLDPFDLEDASPASKSYYSSASPLTAIDLGTGTAILARHLADSLNDTNQATSQTHKIVGVDASPAMLAVAQRLAPATVRFVQADVHDLPFAPNSLHLVVSSFGLNASVPRKSLRTIYQVLRKGQGVLAFQEWSVEDDASRILDETVADHAPSADEILDIDEAVRTFNESPRPWYDHLQDTEDYYEMLKTIGFEQVWVKEAPLTTVHLPSIDVFIGYKTGWPVRRLRLQALSQRSPAAYADFDADLHERLRPYTNSDGSFDWSPMLFRVFAVK